MVSRKNKSSLIMMVLSWIIVLTPLGWGVVQSVIKSLPLFQMSDASKTTISSADK
jgi:hypothetical protein